MKQSARLQLFNWLLRFYPDGFHRQFSSDMRKAMEEDDQRYQESGLTKKIGLLIALAWDMTKGAAWTYRHSQKKEAMVLAMEGGGTLEGDTHIDGRAVMRAVLRHGPLTLILSFLMVAGGAMAGFTFYAMEAWRDVFMLVSIFVIAGAAVFSQQVKPTQEIRTNQQQFERNMLLIIFSGGLCLAILLLYYLINPAGSANAPAITHGLSGSVTEIYKGTDDGASSFMIMLLSLSFFYQFVGMIAFTPKTGQISAKNHMVSLVFIWTGTLVGWPMIANLIGRDGLMDNTVTQIAILMSLVVFISWIIGERFLLMRKSIETFGALLCLVALPFAFGWLAAVMLDVTTTQQWQQKEYGRAVLPTMRDKAIAYNQARLEAKRTNTPDVFWNAMIHIQAQQEQAKAVRPWMWTYTMRKPGISAIAWCQDRQNANGLDPLLCGQIAKPDQWVTNANEARAAWPIGPTITKTIPASVD